MTEEKGNDRGKGREPESVGTPALNNGGTLSCYWTRQRQAKE